MSGSYYFFIRDLGNINDRIDALQQQIAAPAPAPEAKPTDGKAAKGHRGAR